MLAHIPNIESTITLSLLLPQTTALILIYFYYHSVKEPDPIILVLWVMAFEVPAKKPSEPIGNCSLVPKMARWQIFYGTIKSFKK